MAVLVRTRFYREFLTPALHRRFTRAAGLTLIACYIEAILIGDFSSFLWSWFPLGRTGLRTLLLFISTLVVFVLRVAQLHFGARMTKSPFQTFLHYVMRRNSLQTLLFYTFSAWWFGEIYKWSASRGANLSLAADAKPYERQRLNERPIYFWILSIVLAVSQSLMHLHYDYDKASLQEVIVAIDVKLDSQVPAKVSMTSPPLDRLRQRLPQTLYKAATRAVVVNASTLFIHLFVRHWAWHVALFPARLIWSIPRASEPSKLPPYHITLLWRSTVFSVLLVSLWEISNAAFSVYVAKEPLKKGLPLTTESRDPNGSLLNGLKARKEAVRSFAFWELFYISQHFESRRKTIYSELDREGGPTWAQILSVSLNTIEHINRRIALSQKPVEFVPPAQIAVQGLPRLSTPLKEDNILRNPSPVYKTSGSRSTSSPLSPQLKKVMGAARDKLLTKDQQAALSPAQVNSSLHDVWSRFLHSRVGTAFRQTFRRRVSTVILASPYGDITQIVNAIDSITLLAVASLKEDQYGMVNKDIPLMTRTFVSTIRTIETFVQELPVHWTDVKFQESDENGRKTKETEHIISHLKSGLKQLLEAFGPYAVDLGLKRAEIREFRQIAGLPPL